MDSAGIEAFIAVWRAGGFSAAGKVLHLSQPAVSRRIALLEERLGAPLFERTATEVVLSQAGEALLPHAERALAALQDGATAVRSVATGGAGVVSLVAVGTLAGPRLTVVLECWKRQFPDARLALSTATSAEVSEIVRRGQASVGLRYFEDYSSDLESHELASERLVVACSTRHALAGKRVARLVKLKHERWLAFPSSARRADPSSANVFAQFLTRGVAEIDWTAVDSLTAQKRLIEAGFGIGLLPESAIFEELRARSVALIRVADLAAANPVVAVVRRGGYLSAAATGLLESLRHEL